MIINFEQRPFIKGREQLGWCGPCSLSYVAGLFGIVTSQKELADKIYDSEWGTSGEDMVRGCKILGLDATWVQGLELSELDAQRHGGDEVILNYMDEDDPGKDGHYGVLRGLEQGLLAVDDPSTEGRITVFREEDFVKYRWYDVDEFGFKLEKWALIVRKP